MTTVNFDFTGMGAGVELHTFEPLFPKLANSSTNTIVGGSTAGTLSYVGSNGTPTTHAFETGNPIHSFKVTYNTNGAGSFLTCCARVVDYRNMLAVRFSATTTLELVSLTTAVPALIEAWTVTRGANDTVEIIVGANDEISVKHNNVLKVFSGTGLTYKVITTFAGATKVGFCARSGASANLITEASVTYVPPVNITGINSGTNSVRIGSTGNTVATTGLTTATSASIGSVAMTSVAGSSSPWTFTCPPLTDGTVSPYPSGTLTITGAEGSPTLAGVVVTLPTDLTSVTLAGTLNTTDTGVLHDFSPAAVVTDKIFYPPIPEVGKYAAIDAQGNIDTNHEGTMQFWHWQASTGITRSYGVILGSGGVVSGGGLTKTKIVVRKLPVRRI